MCVLLLHARASRFATGFFLCFVSLSSSIASICSSIQHVRTVSIDITLNVSAIPEDVLFRIDGYY